MQLNDRGEIDYNSNLPLSRPWEKVGAKACVEWLTDLCNGEFQTIEQLEYRIQQDLDGLRVLYGSRPPAANPETPAGWIDGEPFYAETRARLERRLNRPGRTGTDFDPLPDL